MTKHILGVDGGGTRTRVAVVDDAGRLCGFGTSGSSNYHDQGLARAQAHVAEAVRAARERARMEAAPFDAALLGMGGVLSSKDADMIRRLALDLRLAPPEHVEVYNDCRTALAGGLSGRPGLVQIAGTGSVTYGRNAAGDAWRAGGWGEVLADEGSAYWLGLQAMKAAVRAFDERGKPTSLLPAVQDALGLGHLKDIMYRLYVTGLSRSEIAALAPLVIEAARDADPVALSLIDEGAAEMADAVLAVAQHLGMTEAPCEMALVGGLFEAGDVVIEPFKAAVSERVPRCRVQMPELPPVLGACLLGLERLHGKVGAPILQNLRGAAQRLSS